MNIIEAAKKAKQADGWISVAPFVGHTFFDMSDTPVMLYNPEQKTKGLWNPTTEELISEEWEVVTAPESSREALLEYERLFGMNKKNSYGGGEMMETKEMLLKALREDLNILMEWQRDMPKIEEVTRLSAEIRRVVSLIAEIDHE